MQCLMEICVYFSSFCIQRIISITIYTFKLPGTADSMGSFIMSSLFIYKIIFLMIALYYFI